MSLYRFLEVPMMAYAIGKAIASLVAKKILSYGEEQKSMTDENTPLTVKEVAALLRITSVHVRELSCACGHCVPCMTHARAKFDPSIHEVVEKNSSSKLDLTLSKVGKTVEVIELEDKAKNNDVFVRYA